MPPTTQHHVPGGFGAPASAGGFKVFAQEFEDDQPRRKLAAFYSAVVARLLEDVVHVARALIGLAALSSLSILFDSQERGMRFVHAVRDHATDVRFPLGDPSGGVITFMPQRPPSKYGAALSQVWEVVSPLLRASEEFQAIPQARFMTDPRRGLSHLTRSTSRCSRSWASGKPGGKRRRSLSTAAQSAPREPHRPRQRACLCSECLKLIRPRRTERYPRQ